MPIQPLSNSYYPFECDYEALSLPCLTRAELQHLIDSDEKGAFVRDDEKDAEKVDENDNTDFLVQYATSYFECLTMLYDSLLEDSIYNYNMILSRWFYELDCIQENIERT
jgi:hypothetical protein